MIVLLCYSLLNVII